MDRISAVVFSKDRPLFLEAHLETLAATVFKNKMDVSVYFMASSSEMLAAYDYVRNKHLWARFEIQHSREELLPFMQTWIKNAGEFILMTVDDNIWGGEIDVGTIFDTLRDEDVFGFNLRLHSGIRHTHIDGGADDPGPVSRGRVTIFEPSKYRLPWNYVWEVSSTIFRRETLWKVLNCGQPILTPNALELVGLGIFPTSGVKKVACFDWAPATNIFVNSWLSLAAVTNRVTDEAALQMFKDGRKVDVERTFRCRDEAKSCFVKELFLKDLS